MTTSSSRVLATIDVGTNSVHMVIARVTSGHSPEILARERTVVRLGAGGGDMRNLSPAAIKRVVEALTEFRYIADAHNAEIIAVATSAVREADNRWEFLREVREKTGISIEVISGIEEARLIHLGALHAVPIADQPHLVIDIGGGSTELITAAKIGSTLFRSLKLGHIRLTDRFFPQGIIKPGMVKACRDYIRSFTAPTVQEIRKIGFEVVIGCSGTIATVATICARHLRRTTTTTASEAKDTPANTPTKEIVRTTEISKQLCRLSPERRERTKEIVRTTEISKLLNELVELRKPEDRCHIAGLSSKRRDVIVAGVVLLEQLCADLEIRKLVVSSAALREGLLIDRCNRYNTSRRDELTQPIDPRRHTDTTHKTTTQPIDQPIDPRRTSVFSLADTWKRTDSHHDQYSTGLALDLFDTTRFMHSLTEPDRSILEIAGLLRNIGLGIAHSAHHKHSYYLIRHSDRLVGFSENERELIALVARYHRKRHPVKSHTPWMTLDNADRHRVKVLAGLLRIGIALDRTYRQAVELIEVSTLKPNGIIVEITPHNDIPVDVELFTAQQRCKLLEEALDCDVRFHMKPTDGSQEIRDTG
ncbi:MAG: Ppx/GppA phosphatase family protein [Acidimicrobiaceae bacterium]|nr:Ppx/GppA phosphatase family protein [Acidimicrobiaceae bacterium]